MTVFSAYPADNKRNWHNSTSEADCKEWANWSEQQEADQGIDSIIRISNNTTLQTIKVVRIEEENRTDEDQFQSIWLGTAFD